MEPLSLDSSIATYIIMTRLRPISLSDLISEGYEDMNLNTSFFDAHIMISIVPIKINSRKNPLSTAITQ